jgi:hypothetical protein
MVSVPSGCPDVPGDFMRMRRSFSRFPSIIGYGAILSAKIAIKRNTNKTTRQMPPMGF